MDFKLHPQLKNDLLLIGQFDLSLIFVLPDSDHPWIVLVPQINDTKEFHQLSSEQQNIHCTEITKISVALEELFSPDKLNIGMLGNMVPQLHTHIICRFQGDRSWPGSLWGSKLAGDEKQIAKNIESIKGHLKLC